MLDPVVDCGFWDGTFEHQARFLGIFLVWTSHDITDRFGVQFLKFVHILSRDDGYGFYGFYLGTPRIPKGPTG